MDVVRHQAPGEELEAGLCGVLSHEREVQLAVFFVVGDVHRPHAALRDVVRQARGDDARDPWHGARLPKRVARRQVHNRI